MTAFATLKRNGSNRRARKNVANRLDRRAISKDREVLAQLSRLVLEPEFNWLRSASFAGSWRDDHSARLRDVHRFDGGDHRFSDPALQRAVTRFTKAAGAFLRTQDNLTVADPIMRDPAWRTIGRIGPNGEMDVLSRPEELTAQARLRNAAAEVCESHDALVSFAGSRLPPNRPSLPSGRRHNTRDQQT